MIRELLNVAVYGSVVAVAPHGQAAAPKSEPIRFTLGYANDPTRKVPEYDYLIPLGWKDVTHMEPSGQPSAAALGILRVQPPEQGYAATVIPFLSGINKGKPDGRWVKSAEDELSFLVKGSPNIKNWQVLSSNKISFPGPPPEFSGEKNRSEIVVERCKFSDDGITKEAVVVARLDRQKFNVGESWIFKLLMVAAPSGHLESDQGFLRKAATFVGSVTFSFRYAEMLRHESFITDPLSPEQRVELPIATEIWKGAAPTPSISEELKRCELNLEMYSEGGGASFELPKGISRVWMNDKQDLILADDPTFTPDSTYGTKWRRIKKGNPLEKPQIRY